MAAVGHPALAARWAAAVGWLRRPDPVAQEQRPAEPLRRPPAPVGGKTTVVGFPAYLAGVSLASMQDASEGIGDGSALSMPSPVGPGYQPYGPASPLSWVIEEGK